MLPTKDPAGDPMYLRLADIYLEMGFRGEALAQYRNLFKHYASLGRKDKALKVIALMAQMHPGDTDLKNEIASLKHLMKSKDRNSGMTRSGGEVIPEESFGENRREAFFDLGGELEMVEAAEIRDYKEIEISEKVNGFKEIFKKLKEDISAGSVDPNWNYHMGVACRELGCLDDAIEHLWVSYEKEQNPFEAAYLMGLCFKEKVMWEEALQAFEKALSVDGISQKNILTVRYEMALIFQKQGKTEEALELLRKISAGEQGFQNAREEVYKFTKKSPKGYSAPVGQDTTFQSDITRFLRGFILTLGRWKG